MKKRLLIIIITFSVSFISMVGLSLYSLARFNNYVDYSQRMDHTNNVLRNLYKTEGYLKDLERAERGFILTRDTMYERYANNSIDSVRPMIKLLEALVCDNQAQLNNIALLKSSIALRINFARTDMQYADTAKTSVPSSYYNDGRKAMKEAVLTLRAMQKIEYGLLAERLKNQQFYQEVTTSTLKYLVCIFCAVTLILFTIMVHELRARIRYQDELQAKILDLKRSHVELREIAYAASHDLQEPLRKIQVFSNMLLYQRPSEMSDETHEKLSRINSSAGRMQQLITALVSLTNLTNNDEMKSDADLNRLLEYLLIDMDDEIIAKTATVHIQPLPVINGYDHQLRLLFKSLLENSLKFARDGVNPVITIGIDIVNGYELLDLNPNLKDKQFYRITCADNGIGFDNQFISKIFQIFQRLHTQDSEYEGKGIGLAICQRVMANHEGYIIAHGEPGKGAQFKLFFPLVIR